MKFNIQRKFYSVMGVPYEMQHQHQNNNTHWSSLCMAHQRIFPISSRAINEPSQFPFDAWAFETQVCPDICNMPQCLSL